MLNLLRTQSAEIPATTILHTLIKTIDGQIPDETQISREDLQQLKLQFDDLLRERSAQNFDVCPIRQQIHRELFDEMIREIYLEQEETGILLAKLRDEAHMTASTYETVYDKTMEQVDQDLQVAEDGFQEMIDKQEKLKEENDLLKQQLIEIEQTLKTKIENINLEYEAKQKENERELNFYKKQLKQIQIIEREYCDQNVAVEEVIL